MDVVKMSIQIALVADYVIPETSLPEMKRLCDVVSLLEIEGVVALDAM